MPTFSHPSLPDLDLVFVQGGKFSMGNNKGEHDWEKPEHPVKVSDYYIGKYPVTQRLWEALMGNNPSRFKGDPAFGVTGRRPVENVSWNDAGEFIKYLNEQKETREWIRSLDPPGEAFQLPTEAQWEFAARGGNDSRQYKFSGSDKLKQVGWYTENSGNETKEVGLLLPNELGIYDMSGNVWEWCSDWYNSKYYEECRKQGPIVDPSFLTKGSARVYRGGSYYYRMSACRPSHRSWYSPESRRSALGFRLVLSLQSVG